MNIETFYKDKKILITGAAGTIGQELVRQLYELKAGQLRLMDINETDTFFLMEEYKESSVYCFLGSVRDLNKLDRLAKGIDIIIHTAAYKHVILSEYNPFDVVQTNIIGVENVIRAAINNNVPYVIFTSSDKAVNPTNVMGTSKLMGERLITAANAVKDSDTIFTSARFGNVIGSKGSVVPLFVKQIKNGGPLTLTDKKMSRFIMTTEEAARLVLKSLLIAKGGEVFITKMPVVRIQDLADVLIEMLAPRYGYNPSDVKIIEIGAKPGEKLYEELISEEEVHRSIELEEAFFVVTPAFKAIYEKISYIYTHVSSSIPPKRAYVSASEQAMDKPSIKKYLSVNKVLERLI
ncbi:polysaccharide biosynthesis protein CapD [Candidatus Magnetoovum chiemensis]|nr:polysaccharide biosynthesis protein CapD [Candidatus Magnetoovum chiemensis]